MPVLHVGPRNKMNELHKFGEFFVQNSRDKMLDNLEGILAGKWKDAGAIELQEKLGIFTDDQKEVIRE